MQTIARDVQLEVGVAVRVMLFKERKGLRMMVPGEVVRARVVRVDGKRVWIARSVLSGCSGKRMFQGLKRVEVEEKVFKWQIQHVEGVVSVGVA